MVDGENINIYPHGWCGLIGVHFFTTKEGEKEPDIQFEIHLGGSAAYIHVDDLKVSVRDWMDLEGFVISCDQGKAKFSYEDGINEWEIERSEIRFLKVCARLLDRNGKKQKD